MFNKQAAIEIMRKAARCWAGYEPVPGAKAYSKGSCRPKGSKKTQKEVVQGKKHTEKKAAGPALEFSDDPLTPEQAMQIRDLVLMHGNSRMPLYNAVKNPEIVKDTASMLEQLKKHLQRQKSFNLPPTNLDYEILKVRGGTDRRVPSGITTNAPFTPSANTQPAGQPQQAVAQPAPAAPQTVVNGRPSLPTQPQQPGIPKAPAPIAQKPIPPMPSKTTAQTTPPILPGSGGRRTPPPSGAGRVVTTDPTKPLQRPLR